MSVYEFSPIMCRRRTKAGLEELDAALAEIVEKDAPITVRGTFNRAVVAGLVPNDEARGYKLVQRRLVARFFEEIDGEACGPYSEWPQMPSEEILERQLRNAEVVASAPDHGRLMPPVRRTT